MKPIKTIRLTIALPILVIGSVFTLLIFSVIYLHNQTQVRIERKALDEVRQLLANTEFKIETLARHNQISLIAEEIAELGVNTRINAMALIDDRGYILHATQLGWLGRHYHDVLPEFSPAQIEITLREQNSTVETVDNGNRLIGYQAAALALEKDQIRPTKIGILLLDYDLSQDRLTVWNDVLAGVYPILLCGLFIMLLTYCMIDLWVKRPIKHLTLAFSRFGQGDYQSRTQLTGSGELVVLGTCWNQAVSKLAETIRQLELSNEQYAVTLMSIGDAVISTDVYNRVTFMNKAAEQLTGWTCDEVLGKSLDQVYNIIHSSDGNPAVSRVKAVLENNDLSELSEDIVLLDRHGNEHQIADSAAAISSASGQISGVVLVFRDISEEYGLKQSLMNERSLLRSLIDAVPDLIFYKDLDHRYVGCNAAFTQFVGKTQSQIIGLTDYDLFDESMANTFRSKDLEITAHRANQTFEEVVFDYPNKPKIYFEDLKTPFYSKDGRLLGLVGIARNITERKLIEEKLQESEERIRSLGNNLPNGYIYQYSTTHNGLPRFEFISAGVEKLHGLSVREVLNSPMTLLNQIDSAQWPAYQREVRRSAQDMTDFRMELLMHLKNGSDLWLQVNSRPKQTEFGLVWDGVAIDITEKKASEEQIWHQANFDPLTELPNRRMFLDRLRQEVKKAHRSGSVLAVLFIDLDRFKEINDTLGHDLGDQLLKIASERLQTCVRDCDTVARLGGDEFTIILTDLDSPKIDPIAEQILARIAEPIMLNEEACYISASIGITLYPTDAHDVMQLLKHADQAMYAAKEMGRNGYSYYTSSLQEAARKRLALIQDLRVALSQGQFEVHYQPIVHLQTGTVNKAEALIRWHHPQKGEMDPAEFIPLAEEIGLINDISNWVFKQAVRHVNSIRTQGHPRFQVSINKSPLLFRNSPCPFNWKQYLQELQLPGDCLVVEITEGLLLDSNSGTLQKLLDYRDAGIEVALDDFGTGYSALSYLKKFHIDYLKIDRSFVRNLSETSDDMILCEAIIVMAHKLGIQVIAEGIETEQQMQLLLKAGCDFGQGFWFSPALQSQDLIALVLQTPSAVN